MLPADQIEQTTPESAVICAGGLLRSTHPILLVLGFGGIGPIQECSIGMIEAGDNTGREKWLAKMRALGREGR